MLYVVGLPSPLALVVGFREPQWLEPATGFHHALAYALFRALAVGVVSVLTAPTVGHIHRQQQAQRIVVVLRCATSFDLQVPKTSAIVTC